MSALIASDTSVALKWVVDEPGSDAASALLTDMIAGELTLVAPEHLIGEVSNGLRKRVAQKILTPDHAVAALDAIAALDMELVSGPARWFRCLPSALDWHMTTYDALYVQLAAELRTHVVTADQRLPDSAQQHDLPVQVLAAGT